MAKNNIYNNEGRKKARKEEKQKEKVLEKWGGAAYTPQSVKKESTDAVLSMGMGPIRDEVAAGHVLGIRTPVVSVSGDERKSAAVQNVVDTGKFYEENRKRRELEAERKDDPYYGMNYTDRTNAVKSRLDNALQNNEIDDFTYYSELAKYDTDRMRSIYNKSEVRDMLNEKYRELDLISSLGQDNPRYGSYSVQREKELKTTIGALESMLKDNSEKEILSRAKKRDDAVVNAGILAGELESQGYTPIYDAKKYKTADGWDNVAAVRIYHAINNGTDTRAMHTNGGDVEHFMYAGEKNIFNLLMNAGKTDEAMKFYNEIYPDLEVRARAYETEKEAEYAKEHPVLGRVKTSLLNPVNSFMAAVDDIGDKFTGQEINPFDASSRAVNRGNVRTSVGREAIEDKYGKFAAGAYDFIGTGVDMAIDFLIAKGTGGLTGSEKAAKTASYASMFTRSYASMADSIKMRGGSDGQAMLGGVLSGGIEVLTENMTWSEILEGKLTDGFFKKIIKSAIPNAGEELSASVLGMVSDAIVMQDKSESRIRIKELMRNGVSAEEAKKTVFKENFKQILYEGGLGGVVGGTMTGVGAAINTIAERNPRIEETEYTVHIGNTFAKNPNALKRIVELGINNENPEVGRMVEDMQNGIKPSPLQIGEAVKKVVATEIEKDGGMMNILNTIAALEGRGADYIGSQESIDTAKAVMNFVRNKATDVDKALISRSDGATILLTAIEKNSEALKSIKNAAKTELRETTSIEETSASDAESDSHAIVRDNDVFDKDGMQVTISDKSDVQNGVVVDDESKRMKETDSKGYSVAEKLATDLKKPVKFVKGLYDAAGKMLDGVETDSGIFINTEAKNPIKWAVTHEFSHTMKKSAGKAWSAYQNFVVNKLKKDGSYYAIFDAKAKAYGTTDADYINEEIAADHIGELFDSVDELADFIKKDRGLAVKVRDFYYKVFDRLGLVDEKKKAQLMWRDAYRKAVLNVAKQTDNQTRKSVDVRKSVSYGKTHGESGSLSLETENPNALTAERGKVEKSGKREPTIKKSISGTRASGTRASENEGITQSDINVIQALRNKTSINDFTSAEIQACKNIAKKFYLEMKEKSPFFRAWFGDWRAYDKTPIKITKFDSNASLPGAYITNKDTNMKAHLGSRLKSETRTHAKGKQNEPIRLMLIENSEEAFKNAILLNTETSTTGGNKMRNTLFMHSFYGIFETNGNKYIYKIFVEEFENNSKIERRGYEIKDIKIKPMSSNGLTASAGSPQAVNIGYVNSVADLFALVNNNDANFNPNPVNPDLLNDDGTPKNLYHQTSEEIDIFEPRHKGAGTTDEETPFGIFLKPTPEDIGLKGKHQMAVYAHIANPLNVADRTELVSSLKTLSSEFSTLYDNYKNLNKEYKKKAEKAEKEFDNYVKKWREANPGASRIDIYKEAEFDEIFEAEGKIVEEWETNARKAELEIKEVITKTLKDNNYDGVHLLKDAGSGGRMVETWIALEPEQVKSATDNIGTFDKGNPNNKKSISGTRASEISDSLKEENARLRSELENAHIQLNQAEGKSIDVKEVKRVAQDFRKQYGSKVRLSELHQDLTKLYNLMQSDKATADEVSQRVSEIADKVIDNATQTVTNDEYSELLDRIKNTKIMVPELERADFRDGYETFRKGNMGKITLVNDGTDLDVFWDELTEEYPNLFDENILGSEERLERILEVREEFAPREESVFTSDAEKEQARIKLKNDIMDAFYDIPEGESGTKYVFYDKRVADVEKELTDISKKLDLSNKKTTRAGIDSDFNYLSQMLKNPTDNKHVPENMRAGVAALLRCFNYETKYLDKLKDAGKEADSPTAVKISDMYNAYTNIIKASWGIENTEQQFIDQFLTDDLKEMMGEIPVDESGGFKRLEDMSIEELRSMAKVLRSVHHTITQRNKAFNTAIKEEISELGFNTAEDFKSTRARRKGSGEKVDDNDTVLEKAVQVVDKYFNYDNVQPWDFFHEMGGTMERLYMEERKGFDKHVLNLKSAAEAMQKATEGIDLDKITGKGAPKIRFKTSFNEELVLSKGQILSLYALYNRKQGKEHILGGGIVTGKKYYNADGQKGSANTAHPITEADLGKLFDEKNISSEEKKMVKAVVEFMSTECAKWGNETSMKLYGYEKFGESWYFPIKVSNQTLNTYYGEKGEGNQRTQGFTKKTTKNASNAVIISDFFDTVTSHINGVSLYNSTALPMLDMERVLNYNESGSNVKVRADLIRTFGKSAEGYIEKFHKDENGSTKTEKSGFEKLVSLNKKASIGFNARVLVQQPTSIARAYMFLSPKDIPKSFKGVKMIKEMREVCPIAYWKSLGFRDIGTGSSLKTVLLDNESLYSKAEMGMYGLADDLTWGLIYGAVKNETIRKKPDLKVGSKEFNEKVRDRFNYIVDRTQVVDSVFHRTQNMRSNSDIVKNTTMFMSEALKTYNLYRTEMIDAVKEKRKFKTAARATAVYAASNLLLALAQAFPDAWREDDEKELFDKKGNPIGYWGMYRKKFKEDLLDDVNPLNSFPIIKDVWGIVQGFRNERIEYSRLNDFIISCQNLGNDKMSLPAKLTSLTTSAAAVFGISAGNLKRDVFGFIETIFRANGKEYNDYLIDKFKHNVKSDSNKAKFMRHYERAMANGHADDAAIILEDYMAETFKGKDFNNEHTEAVTKEASKLLGKTDNDSKLLYSLPDKKFSLDGEKTTIPDKDYPEYVEGYYNTLYDLAHEMVTDKRYSELSDEDKVRSFGDIEEYAKATQLSEMFDGYDLSGWKEEVYDGKTKFMDSVFERAADREFSDKKESYLEGLNFDESKYSEAELGIIEDVENKWAGYKASKDLNREIDESKYRHIIVYEDKLSNEMPLEEYAGVRAYAKKTAALYDLNDADESKGTEALTAKELEQYLDSTDYSWETKSALFMAIGNSNWYNKYTGLKNNGEPRKGGGGGSSGGSSSRGNSRSSTRSLTRSSSGGSTRSTRTARTTIRRSNR